ncbi:acyl carrier protein [Lentzea atacamensis]|uniref:Acyl carrier protein n=2 Tax=Lentzea TaxID=165301 RepID=A0A316HWF7_9PSEU|nr:phosphopantetheine-binding protein [Lentzea atacamensis]PWK84994.1 acyl carrier protein [Lentzea atacamensis]RAS66004.1 acyl carrier protein [Lentzea atacamensis]
MSEVFVEVAGLVGQVTDLPVEEISADSRFDSLANWTSYEALRLLTGIEQRFSVRLDLQEYFALKDVGGLVAAVSSAQVKP